MPQPHNSRSMRRTGVHALTALIFLLTVLATVSSPARTADVFLRIAATLDEPRGLCVDIPGHRDRVNTDAALVVHTCKWDIWNDDERFDSIRIVNGLLRMPAYDLCAGAASASGGAAIVLSKCEGTKLQIWTRKDGLVRLSAHRQLCLTVGPEPSELTPGGRRLESRHVARSLALDICRTEMRDRQTWRVVDPDNR